MATGACKRRGGEEEWIWCGDGYIDSCEGGRWSVSCSHACMHRMHVGNTLHAWQKLVGLAFIKILLMFKT